MQTSLTQQANPARRNQDSLIAVVRFFDNSGKYVTRNVDLTQDAERRALSKLIIWAMVNHKDLRIERKI